MISNNFFKNDTFDKIYLIKNEKEKRKTANVCSVYISAVEWNSSDEEVENERLHSDYF